MSVEKAQNLTKEVTKMKHYTESGYQGVTFTGNHTQRTPLFYSIKTLIEKLESARNMGLIDHYFIQYVHSKVVVLSEIDIEPYKEKE